MFIEAGGMEIDASRYTSRSASDSTPTNASTSPASATSTATAAPNEIASLHTALTQASLAYNDDMTALNTAEGDEQQAEQAPHNTGVDFRLAGDESSTEIGVDAANVSKLSAKVAADRKTVSADKAKLASATQDQKTAKAYKSKTPTVTVSDPVTKALAPLVKSADGAKSAAQSAVNGDNAAIASTQQQINALNSTDVAGLGGIRRAQALNGQLAAQKAKLSADKATLTTTSNKAAAVNSAVNAVTFSDQAGTDASSIAAQLKTLHGEGILNSNGTLKSGVTLTPTQQTAYNNYVSTVDRYAADSSTSKQNESQLQVYISNPGKPGSTGADSADADAAVSAVNHALAPLGLMMPAPSAISPATAATNLKNATAATAQADNAWTIATSYGAYVQASQALAALKPGTASYATQEALVIRDQGSFFQALSYSGELSAESALNSGKGTAQQQGEDAWQLKIDQAGLLTASAEVNSAPQLARQAVAEGQLNTVNLQIAQYENGPGVCRPPNKALTAEQTTAQGNVQQDSANPSVQTFDYLNGGANVLAEEYAGWQGTQVKAGVPGASFTVASAITDSNPNNAWQTSLEATGAPATAPGSVTPKAVTNEVAQSTVEQELAQYNFGQSAFNLTASYYAPTTAGQNAESTAWANYARQHGLKISDSQVASYLESLQPGQKANVAAGSEGAEEISSDQSTLQSAKSNEGWLEQSYNGLSDLFTGSTNTSGEESYLQDKATALSQLGAQQGSLSSGQEQLDFANIMGGLGPQFGQYMQSMQADTNSWSQVENTVVDVAAATVAGALGGVGGVVAGVLISQLSKEADNALTVVEGGNVEQDPNGVSIFTAGTDNFFTGGDSWHEVAGASVGLGVDTLNAAGGVLGAQLGGAASGLAATRWIPAMLTNVGMKGLTVASADAGTDELAGIATANMEKSWLVRAAVHGVNLGAYQFGAGSGQVAGTGLQGTYEVIDGQETGQQALDQVGVAVRNTAVSTVTGAVTGGIGGIGLLGDGVASTFVTQGLVNTGMSVATNYLTGQSALMSPSDWVSDILSTGVGTVQHAMVSNNSPTSAEDTPAADESDPAQETQYPQGASPAEPTAPTSSPGLTPGNDLEHVISFNASHFPTADLAYTTTDPVRNAGIRQFAEWMAETANKGRVQLTTALGTSSSPENTIAALKDLLEFLQTQRKVKAAGTASETKIDAPIVAGDPNIDPFGDVGNTALGPLQRLEIGSIISNRLGNVTADSMHTQIQLPGFEQPFQGNRLIQGPTAESINAAKGDKYGFQGSDNMYFTETAPPTAQEQLRNAAVQVFASLVSRSAAVQASPTGRTDAFDEYATGLYSLFHAPIYNRGSDSAIRLFGGIVYRQVFGQPAALPQNVDIMAYATDQNSFVGWLRAQMPNSTPGDSGANPTPTTPTDGPPGTTPLSNTAIGPEDVYSRASIAGTVYEVGPDTPPVVSAFLSRALSNNAYDSMEHLQLRAQNYADLGDAEVNVLNSALDELQRPDSPLVMQNSWLAHLERGLWGNDVFGAQDRMQLGDEAAGLTDPSEGSPFYGSASRKVPLTQRSVQIPDELRSLLGMTLHGEYGPLTFDDAMQGLSLNSIGPMIASKLDSDPANDRTTYWKAQRLKAERGDTGIAKSELGVELSQDVCTQILDQLGMPVATGLSSTLADTVNLAKYAAQQQGTSWAAPGLTEDQARLAMIDLGMIYMRQGAIPGAVARGINTLRGELGLPPKLVSPERVFTHSYGEIHVGVTLAAQGGSATDPVAIGAAAAEALQRLMGYRMRA